MEIPGSLEKEEDEAALEWWKVAKPGTPKKQSPSNVVIWVLGVLDSRRKWLSMNLAMIMSRSMLSRKIKRRVIEE